MNRSPLLRFWAVILVAAAAAPSARAERPCAEIAGAVVAAYEKQLACARARCPDFRVLDLGTPAGDECAAACAIAWEGAPPTGTAADLRRCEHYNPKHGEPDYFRLALCLAASEADLERCRGEFSSRDERDFFVVASCLAASEVVGEAVGPFQQCITTGECARRKSVIGDPACLDQCGADAAQLVEVATTTMERCAPLPQAKTALCSMLQRTINNCFLEQHCDRLAEVLKRSCPELLDPHAQTANPQ